MTADLTTPIFNDENAARQFLEAQRWPEGPFCPYCGQFDTVSPFKGKSMGPGWHHCNSCRKKFTVRVGTLYERSHIPLHKWLLATHLLTSSKKGMSAHQLHRMLGITYKSAWFMAHRIREGMRDDSPAPVGGGGKMVEADETYFGNKIASSSAPRGASPHMAASVPSSLWSSAAEGPACSMSSTPRRRTFAKPSSPTCRARRRY